MWSFVGILTSLPWVDGLFRLQLYVTKQAAGVAKVTLSCSVCRAGQNETMLIRVDRNS